MLFTKFSPRKRKLLDDGSEKEKKGERKGERREENERKMRK